MSRYKKQTLTVSVIYDSETALDPHQWDWDQLLELHGDEEIIIEKYDSPQDYNRELKPCVQCGALGWLYPCSECGYE